MQELAQRGLYTFSLDALPRISRAQSMDVLSAMSTVSGYRAAIVAAERAHRFLPMLMTAAGTVAPARTPVLGAGVAGLPAGHRRLPELVVHALELLHREQEEAALLPTRHDETRGELTAELGREDDPSLVVERVLEPANECRHRPCLPPRERSLWLPFEPFRATLRPTPPPVNTIAPTGQQLRGPRSGRARARRAPTASTTRQLTAAA